MAQAPDSGRLFQEDLKSEPFWMLVACILINRTHWRQVKPVLAQLRARCEGPEDMLAVPLVELIEIIRPLGFYNRRASTLRLFCADWLKQPPRHASDVARMSGCGEYALHSYMIFVQNEIPVGNVSDHKLQWYLQNRAEVLR
jgi:methyl-CpG-binding domain protein 4